MEQNEKIHIFKTVICKNFLFYRNKGVQQIANVLQTRFWEMTYRGMGREINGNSKKNYLYK